MKVKLIAGSDEREWTVVVDDGVSPCTTVATGPTRKTALTNAERALDKALSRVRKMRREK